MIAYLNDILIHLWLAFMLIVFGGCLAGIRWLDRRYRIARGGK
ncbi:hypothetical protein [Pseudomonas frederiksbergensis]|nr:hypothetical protein [Pseudomonas frederiksbergensis]